MKILFLDDQQQRHNYFLKRFKGNEIYQAFTSLQAIEALKTESPFDRAHLDHDLGGFYLPSDESSGYEVAKFISIMEPNLRPEFVIVHSHNPDGAFKMLKVLRDAGVETEYIPFG